MPSLLDTASNILCPWSPINQIGFVKEAVVAKPTNTIAGPASADIAIAIPIGQDAVPEIQAPPAGQPPPGSEGNHGNGY